MTPTVTRRPWVSLDPIGRFLLSAVALLDRADGEGVDIAVDGVVIRPADDGVAHALVALCRALRLPMTPNADDIHWSRLQLAASGWEREDVSDRFLVWLEDIGHEAVIV